jgi:PAS domain S-box-containing protein
MNSKDIGKSGSPLLGWDVMRMNSVSEKYKQDQIKKDINFIQSIAQEKKWILDLDLRKLLIKEHTFILTDSSQTIEWVSSAFSMMTGYKPAEVIGQKPKMLQGPLTSQLTRDKIRSGLLNKEVIHDRILNYRKNGEEYWCNLSIYPIFDHKHEFLNYLAVEHAN